VAKYTTTVELTEEEAGRFEEYLNGNCFDARKWLARQLYASISSAAGRYKQPKGKRCKAFRAKGEGKIILFKIKNC
jgi:hypothetical protein